jgi:dGTPase
MTQGISLYTKNDWERRAPIKENSFGEDEGYRTNSRRDYGRLIHSASFRRLQGKTQLFPAHESDFFRNRLTHSLEVAQIAKSIAQKLNASLEFFKERPIDLDLVELAGLAHDIGHPPFGHNGEATLNALMLRYGGFEGNAQTLRLLTRIEKKATTEFPYNTSVPQAADPSAKKDLRLGLNLTYRALASILKYDRPIPQVQSSAPRAHPAKGYYGTEIELVDLIKDHVAPGHTAQFRTIECSIMDVADDIAYSTYDLEDAFKAGFLTPISMISMDDKFKGRIAHKVSRNLAQSYGSGAHSNFSASDVTDILGDLFRSLYVEEQDLPELETLEEVSYFTAAHFFNESQHLADNAYLRNAFTSELVGRFIRGVEAQVDTRHPSMSTVRLNIQTFKYVETLKHFAFELLISSPRLKIVEKRGDQIVRTLFNSFNDDSELMPADWGELYNAIDSEEWHARVVCDYIAGMTDRYCVEMYARLTSENPITIWRPH